MYKNGYLDTSKKMKTLILYTTEGCHLCQFAEEILIEAQKVRKFSFEPIDISNSDNLVDLYGIRIPVVRDKDTHVELNWPFRLKDLLDLF